MGCDHGEAEDSLTRQCPRVSCFFAFIPGLSWGMMRG